MTAVRVSVNDKRPLPTVDGLCTPSLDVCSEDPCDHGLPLPITGQIAYLSTDALALVEQTGLPTFQDAMKGVPPQCSRREPATFAWALRDAAPDAGAAPLRALLLVRCGLVEARDGEYLVARSQLLVYDREGRLEVVSGMRAAAVMEWDQGGADGPKLAHAAVSGRSRSDDMQVDAATVAAAR
jgi:hypothetical protein